MCMLPNYNRQMALGLRDRLSPLLTATSTSGYRIIISVFIVLSKFEF